MPPPSRKDTLLALRRAYPRQDFATANFVAYQNALEDVPPEILAAAVQHLIRTEKWMPTVAEIRECAAELELVLPDEADALAQIHDRMAWARTQTLDPPPVVHPLVATALERVGGWHSFRDTEATVIRGQFARVYRDLRGAAIRARQTSDFNSPG